MTMIKSGQRPLTTRTLLLLLVLACPRLLAAPVKVIIDSDIGPDCDDSGAVAVANVTDW